MDQIAQFQQDIEEHGWQIEAQTQRTSDSAKFYFVRHGMSAFNYLAFKCAKEHTN